MATEQLAQGQHVFCAPVSVEREWHLFCLGSYFSQVVFGKTNAAFVFKRLNFRSNSKQLCNSTGRMLRRLQVISHLSNKTIDTKVLQCFNWMLASFSGHRSSLASPRGGGANCKPLQLLGVAVCDSIILMFYIFELSSFLLYSRRAEELRLNNPAALVI